MNCNLAACVEFDEGLTTLRTRFRALCEADFLFFDHMAIDQHRKRQSIKLTDVTKAVFCSVAISWQLNAVPYLRGVHKPFPQSREETVPVDESCWSTRTISRVHQSCSQTNYRGYWFGNETGCAHAYKI